MKLRNKKTGEIVDWDFSGWLNHIVNPNKDKHYKRDLSEFMDRVIVFRNEWEDVPETPEHWEDAPEEPKGIKSVGNIGSSVHIEMGSKEEAEKAVERLRAWKRLKDKGFRFEGWQDLEACDETEKLIANRIVDGENIVGFKMDDYHDCIQDLNTCFGGEE